MNPQDPNDSQQAGPGGPESAEAERAPEYGERERLLLRSAALDVSSDVSRERALNAGLLAMQKKPQRGRVVPFVAAGLVLAAAAAAALTLRKPAPREIEVAAERARTPVPSETPAPSARTPSPPPCPAVVVARGGAPLLEDWERKDSSLLPFDGRRGNWTNYDDGTGKQNPPDHSALFPSRIPGGRGASKNALHISGGKFTDWGITFGSELADASCYDASAYAGFELWAKGTGKIRIGVQMIDVQEKKYGGFCQTDCFNSHRKVVELGKTWQKFTFRWEELHQLYEGGDRLVLDPKRIRFIEFSVPAESTPFDVWVDDVAFIERR